MSLTSGSIALGGTLFTPFLAYAVHTWGWRSAAMAAGVAFLIGGLPLSLLLRRSPESMGLLPDGEPLPKATDAKESTHSGEEANISLQQTLRSCQFWLLAVATTLRVVCSSCVLVHFVPILVWRGLTEQRAAFFLAFIALLGMPAHLLIGWLGDRLSKPSLMATCMIIASLSVYLLFSYIAEWQLWLEIGRASCRERVKSAEGAGRMNINRKAE